MSSRLSTKRFFITIGLVTLAFCLSGCVYLRLLSFKNQLKAFDENMSVDSGPGLSLSFRNPVVQNSDFVWITNSQPTSKQSLSETSTEEMWTWKFDKRRSQDDHQPYSLYFKTRFKDGLLVQMVIDETFVSLMGKEFILTMFKSVGEAKINTFRRSASSEMTAEELPGIDLPNLDTILSVMGEPTLITKAKKGLKNEMLHRYEFIFFNPKNGKKAGQFQVVFRSDPNRPNQEISGFRIIGKAR